MANLRCFATLTVMALLHVGCATDDVVMDEPTQTTEPAPPMASEIIKRYQQSMCIEDFQAAGMTAAWQDTTMYSAHEAAWCSSCHGGGQFGFYSPPYSADTAQVERDYFKALQTNAAYLTHYVVPAATSGGGLTMVVNRAGFEKIAAGDNNHVSFTLDDEPGPSALRLFHDMTMKRLAAGGGCAPIQ